MKASPSRSCMRVSRVEIRMAAMSNRQKDDVDDSDNDASRGTPQTSMYSTSASGGYESSSSNLEEFGVERTIHEVPELKGHNHVSSSSSCLPCRKEIFRQQVAANSLGSDRRLAILETLEHLGVKVYVIKGENCADTGEVLKQVKRIVNLISMATRVLPMSGSLEYERALLYQDHNERLFNLLISHHAVGPSETWKNYLDSFSGLEAMIALLVLIRSFPCATSEEGIVDTFKPAILSLILGLVLTEEMSLSWLNASMLVRASPSVAAHTLTCPVAPDLMRKLVIFVLALASVASGNAQLILTLMGIGGACLVLLANMGSRAWHFLRWKPQRYSWFGAGFLAYGKAVVFGMVFPYLGHRDIMVGGKAAIEYVIRTSFLAALAFVLSDVDEVQRFLVIGSDRCSQTTVNFCVSVWFFVTLITCLCMVRQIPFVDQKPSAAERFLEPDHSSPAGYRVPSLPDYEIDPSLARTGLPCLSLRNEFMTGIFIAFALSGSMVYLSLTTWDESLAVTINRTISEFT
ncbi:hypothetical protein MPSEU_000020200 [Mayamaea pseudoterrestris]|nr:hypothetical protein MPSEU_000020200 [Mayamaea pseudoterrestris]